MTSTNYVPGTGETDLKKIIMSLQQLATTLATKGSVTEVDTAGLASGGPITSTGTVTVTAASKSDQQTGTSATTVVTPAHQQDHDGVAKAWCLFSGTATGTNAPTAGYNVTSVTRSGAGTYVVNFTTAFSSVNYVCQIMTVNSANNTFGEVNSSAIAVGSVGIFTINQSGGATVDPVSVMVVCYGRQ